MKVLVINVFPHLFPMRDEDIEFFKERFKKEGEETQVVVYDEKTADKDFDAIISYNTTLGCNAEFLKDFNKDFLEIFNHTENTYIYKRDRNLTGVEVLDKCKFKDILLNPKKKVLIAVPCYESCKVQTMQSIYNLIIPTDVETEIVFMQGYTVAQARNKIVQYSLNGSYDYTLFVDSDIILPPVLLVNLLRCDKDVATGWYIKKIEGANVTELYGPDKLQRLEMVNIDEKELPGNGIINLIACGFGCTLVKNDIFKKIDDGNWFEYIQNKERIVSEDIDFCVKVLKAGGQIVVDTTLRCPHVGIKIF